MRSGVAQTISTVAIWAAVAAVLISFRVRGPEHVVVGVMVGMTGFLSVAAAFGTSCIWRTARPDESPKFVHREL